ncbi:MAG: hypothetical protein KA004_08430, partial [Verrucomicrobiales bacterium]|nr:hypothetical protein [Verrucomicrobiales bacterium]
MMGHEARTVRLRGECAATTWADPATGVALHLYGGGAGAHLATSARGPRARNPTSGETMDRSPAYQAAVEEVLPT